MMTEDLKVRRSKPRESMVEESRSSKIRTTTTKETMVSDVATEAAL